MSKQERSTQGTDKQNLNREQKPGAKPQQQGAQAQSGAQDQQQQQSVQDREKQQNTGHHQDGGFSGWEQDHKKDLKQDAKK